jgi:exodeoxyribonuclease VIII
MHIEPGVYTDLSDTEYRRLDAVSRSDLLNWAYPSDKPIDPITATVGTAFHAIMLEPQHFKTRYAVGPDVKRNTKEGKAIYAEADAKATEDGLQLIPHREFRLLREMADTVKNHPQLGPLRRSIAEGKSRAEITVVWDCQGVRLKARLDQVTSKAIVDWKSTGCMDPDQFAESCIKYRYHVQHAMYQDAWQAATGEALPFVFVAVTKRPPFTAWPHRIEQVHVDHGRELYQTLVGLYARKDEK